MQSIFRPASRRKTLGDTLPQQIATIAYQNKRELYGILFRAAAETLLTIAADPKHLGEHNVKILSVQEFGLTVFEPFSPSMRLAFWTVAIRA
jgi:hypothetical protein